MNARLTPGRIALVIALLGLVLLFVGLAVWQVERRTWKHALIERVDQRVHAAPVAAPPRARWSLVTRDDDEYRHVRVAGTVLPGRETFVQAVTIFGSGYWLVVPLRQDDGAVVLVNRGFVSSDDRTRLADHGDRIDVTGLLRVTEPGGRFLRHNDPVRDRWYSRDVQAIATARGLQDVAPYFVDADADPANAADGSEGAVARGVPVGGQTVIAFPDNHLLYAITWSLLALLVGWASIRVVRGDSTSA